MAVLKAQRDKTDPVLAMMQAYPNGRRIFDGKVCTGSLETDQAARCSLLISRVQQAQWLQSVDLLAWTGTLFLHHGAPLVCLSQPRLNP